MVRGISKPTRLASGTAAAIRPDAGHQCNGHRGPDLVFVFFPLGIIFGHVARGQIKRTGEGGQGLATAALVIGYLQVILIVAVIGMAAVLVALGAQ